MDDVRRSFFRLGSAALASLVPGISSAQSTGAASRAGSWGEPGAAPFRQSGAPEVGATIESKLRETISAMDFGARGNGASDDAPAIRLALTHLSKMPEGGTLYLPPGIYQLGSTIAIPNKCVLVGAGCPATQLIAAPGFRGDSLITNAVKNGGQEWASIEKMHIAGNRGHDAICSVAVVDFVSTFVNSYVRDVLISDGSSVGLRVAANAAAGPLLFENIWLARNLGDNLLVENTGSGAVSGLLFINLTSENQGHGKAAIHLRDAKNNGAAQGWHFINTHIEMGDPGPGSRGILIDRVSTLLFDGVQLLTGNPKGLIGIEITRHPENAHLQLRGVTNANLIDPVLVDRWNNVRHGAAHLGWYSTPDVGIFPDGAYDAEFADSIVPDLARGNHVRILTIDSRAFVVAMPVNATDGMTLTLEVANGTKTAMGKIGWSIAPGTERAWSNPAPGRARTVQFRRRSGQWVPVGAPSMEF